MNISLPDSLKAYVEEQVAARGYGTSSEFVRELIRRERDRTRLRDLLLEGATSPVPDTSIDEFLVGQRGRVEGSEEPRRRSPSGFVTRRRGTSREPWHPPRGRPLDLTPARGAANAGQPARTRTSASSRLPSLSRSTSRS